MQDYFHGRFQTQLGQLAYTQPNSVELRRDPCRMFFGGQDWEQCKADLNNIPEEDRAAFILCLFIVVITDQNIYAHFRDKYGNWRAKTQFPKFGWSGFGPHNENPLKILVVPVKKEFVKLAAVETHLPEAMELFVGEVERFVMGQIQIPTADFFTRMCGDRAFQQMGNERVVQRVQECLLAVLRRRGIEV